MARFDGGWIKIHRSILENVVSQRDLFTFGVFNRLLFMANWKESKVIFRGEKITLKPGQLVTGLRELSPDVDEDPYLHRVRSALSYLVLCEAIEQVTSNQGRLITICNWDKYQGFVDEDAENSASDAQMPRKHPASDAQLSEEGKKERNINSAWFESAFAEYQKLPGVKKGPKAEQCFAEQIKTESDFADLTAALNHYADHLADPQNSWRRPKTTFETFLGSKRSGYFWRDFITASSPQKTLKPKSMEEL